MGAYNVINAASMQAGSPEDVSQVLANFQALATLLNGNLDDFNIKAAAGIAASKLAGYPTDATKFLRGDATWAAPNTALELAYAEVAATVNVTGTTVAAADVIVTAPATVLDGSTKVRVEFGAARVAAPGGAGNVLYICLFDGATQLGCIARLDSTAAGSMATPVTAFREFTPSAASHTYSIRGIVNTGTGGINAAAGGPILGDFVPAYIRVSKAA